MSAPNPTPEPPFDLEAEDALERTSSEELLRIRGELRAHDSASRDQLGENVWMRCVQAVDAECSARKLPRWIPERRDVRGAVGRP